MPDFNVRSDSVNVEQIMEQIRARIREKRGVDYTEQQIRELATVKLETFLDPRGVRSDLLDQFKALPKYEPPDLPNYAFEDATLFESHRAAIRWVRKLLMPLLKLLFNPNPLIQALHIQAQLNAMNLERENQREMSRRAMDQLYYELVHNLVIETTRTGIEVKNLKMRVESISSRLEFNERRARALEGVVVYKPSDTVEPPAPQVQRQAPPPQRQYAPPSQPTQQRYTPPQRSYNPPEPPPAATPAVSAAPVAIPGQPSSGQGPQVPGQGSTVPGEGPGQRSRRRRRRRGRRGGGAASVVMGASGSQSPAPAADGSASVDAVEEMDAMDRLDDDGGPESEETHAAAVEHVEQAAIAGAHGDTLESEPRVEPPVVTPPAPHVDPPVAPPAPAIEPPPPPSEQTAATPPPSPDHTDPDPK